jgi:hypothetical protein
MIQHRGGRCKSAVGREHGAEEGFAVGGWGLTCLWRVGGRVLYFRNLKTTANLLGEAIRDFDVPWNSFYVAGLRVTPQGVRAAFTLEKASMPPEVPEKSFSLHPTVTTSRIASFGRPRSASSLRSCRISSIASERL